MPGNTFGTLLKVTTWGESHGPSLGVVIDGCPAGVEISLEEVQQEADRRKPQNNTISTSRKEKDIVELLGGLFEGKTTGAPLAFLVRNSDHLSSDYDALKDVYRPGHADETYALKYGVRDHRGGGRSSGRETICRVIAGAVAKKLLQPTGIRIIGHTVQVGNIQAEKFHQESIRENLLFCADEEAAEKMLKLIAEVRQDHDSIGGIIEIRIQYAPIGLGEPVFDKLHADLAKGLFSIPAVKGVEFGRGFDVANMRGSQNNDTPGKTNNAGGILGGISNGEDMVIRVAIKPASSIGKEQVAKKKEGGEVVVQIGGRHDACIVPRAIPVAESMVALVLADHLLRQRAIQGFANT